MWRWNRSKWINLGETPFEYRWRIWACWCFPTLRPKSLPQYCKRWPWLEERFWFAMPSTSPQGCCCRFKGTSSRLSAWLSKRPPPFR